MAPVRWLTIVLILGATAGVFAQGISSQSSPPAKSAPPVASREATPAPGANPTAKPGGPYVPSQEQALYLVRATLLTLNDANRSGNYTVLRDLASPEFQAKNSAADLGQIFADLRRRNFDLFAAALLTPTFNSAPALDANGRLHLTGFFPTRPMQINFDLMFEVVNGQWRLFGIAVATPEPGAKVSVNQPHRSAVPYYGLRILTGTAGARW
ncbi:MAG TPA: hypothetical protein VKW06_08135 [Candidatus Angelobacter sp.]|nr:hypothetical protein [Candidatus Angelobacter sp.]